MTLRQLTPCSLDSCLLRSLSLQAPAVPGTDTQSRRISTVAQSIPTSSTQVTLLWRGSGIAPASKMRFSMLSPERTAIRPLLAGLLTGRAWRCLSTLRLIRTGMIVCLTRPLLEHCLRSPSLRDSVAGETKLRSSATNTTHRYYEWFPGYDYVWYEGQAANPDVNRYYAWVITPAGEVGFVSYVGTANNGNEILVDQILSPAGAGTSGKGLAVVGNIDSTGRRLGWWHSRTWCSWKWKHRPQLHLY